MMNQFRLLLLDANIVIKLFAIGIWDKVIDLCDVHLARSVAEDEAHFYKDADGERRDFDLRPYVQDGRVTVFDVVPSELTAFRSEFDLTYLERLDVGEAESLAYLLNSAQPCLICSADSIVYRVLGNLDRSGQGLSLEEVLQQIGLGRQVSWPFSKAFRELWTKKGFQDRVRGTGWKGG